MTQNGKFVACSSVSGTSKIMKNVFLTQFGNATHIASTDNFFYCDATLHPNKL